MKKILSLFCLMMLVMTSAWAGEVATFNLSKSPGVSTPEGFFTHEAASAAGKWNWNSKFNGAVYDDISFSQGLKMEGATAIDFSTEFVSTVTIVQSTWSDKTIKLDGVELAVADAEAGTGCRIYTVADVEAGDHTISRGSGESGLFYVKVEWEAEKTVTFINDANWEKVYVWAWNDTENFTGGSWPGVEMTADADNTFTWTTKGNPTKIIFNDGAGTQTTDQDFKAGGVYNSAGRVITLSTFTAIFKTDGMDEAWAYVWNGDEKALGEWPGTKMEGASGEFSVTIEAEEAPKFIIFHDNQGNQTPDWTFEDGKAYEFNLNEYAVTFTTDAVWETVYAYAWSGDGDTAKKFAGDWPGTALTPADGVCTFSVKAFAAPEKILFNNGDAKTPDMGFTNGRAYKWNTTLNPICKFEASDAAIPAGTTVGVKNGTDVVATLTFGVSGGADFAAPSLRANEEYAAFQNYTGGNGENGSADGGTVYIIKPKYDGTITVGVWLNADKQFYIQEDGTSLEGFDGIKKSYASGTGFEFPVKAGSEYKVYCTGSKLGFYGFDYTFEQALNTYTATFKTNMLWDAVYAYAWSGEGDDVVTFLGDWPGTQVTDVDDTNDDYDIYTLTFKAAEAPEKIIFSNGEGGKVDKTQTADLDFENGKEYSLIYTPTELMEEAMGLALDEEAVAVGKLKAAIQWAFENDDESQLQAAIDAFKENNADQEKDETAKVAVDWQSWTGATGFATWAAPQVTTYDGRTTYVVENFNGTTGEVTGEIFSQTITGLNPGDYKVAFFANANSTADRDAAVETGMEDGATDVAYVFANDAQEFLVAHRATSISENGEYSFEMTLTDADDGTIKLGLGKAKAGTNWHTMQIKQLTWFTTAKAVYAELQKELDQLLFAGAFDLDNENMTEGKEEFRLAFGKASAAKGSNWYNIPELQDIIDEFQAAAMTYQKANWYIDFPAGQYYVIEAESGLMMAAGHDYGTRGIINETGLDLTLTPYTESRTVTFDSRVSNGGDNHFLGQNLYMDSSAWGFALQYQGFGFYILEPNSGKYINVDLQDNLVLSDTPREFIIVSADGVFKERMEELAEATVNNPIDATFLLKDPNFNRNDQRVEAWEWSPMGDAESNPSFWNNHNFSGGNGVNNCAESYHAAFTVRQTVSGAPVGFYEMTAQGFYRQDDDVEEAAPQFFANGVNADVPAKTGSEDSMSSASVSFTTGSYTIKPISFEVTDDGMLYVGVYTEATHQWVIWDNFQLKYFGNPATGIANVVDNSNSQSNAIFNLAGQRVNKAQKGLFIVNGKKVVK